MDGIVHPAGGTMKFAFQDLFFVFLLNPECKVSLADRTAENVHE
jgi:hypothetical protein